MLNSEFTFAFEDFSKCETQVQFHASLDSVSTALNDGYMKWMLNGLGEAYGFWFRLKENKKPFIVKTLVQSPETISDQVIEWLIDAEDVETAMLVFKGLKLGDGITVSWKKS